MLKGGVIMDVTTADEARTAEEAGAVAVMALERVPADIRKDGGVARMSDASVIREIKEAVTIPVMAKARIGHFVEAQILEALDVDYVDESEVRARLLGTLGSGPEPAAHLQSQAVVVLQSCRACKSCLGAADAVGTSCAAVWSHCCSRGLEPGPAAPSRQGRAWSEPFVCASADRVGAAQVLTPADDVHHINKHNFKVPFVCGCRDLGEALRRIAEGAAMIRTKVRPHRWFGQEAWRLCRGGSVEGVAALSKAWLLCPRGVNKHVAGVLRVQLHLPQCN